MYVYILEIVLARGEHVGERPHAHDEADLGIHYRGVQLEGGCSGWG